MTVSPQERRAWILRLLEAGLSVDEVSYHITEALKKLGRKHGITTGYVLRIAKEEGIEVRRSPVVTLVQAKPGVRDVIRARIVELLRDPANYTTFRIAHIVSEENLSNGHKHVASARVRKIAEEEGLSDRTRMGPSRPPPKRKVVELPKQFDPEEEWMKQQEQTYRQEQAYRRRRNQ